MRQANIQNWNEGELVRAERRWISCAA